MIQNRIRKVQGPWHVLLHCFVQYTAFRCTLCIPNLERREHKLRSLLQAYNVTLPRQLGIPLVAVEAILYLSISISYYSHFSDLSTFWLLEDTPPLAHQKLCQGANEAYTLQGRKPKAQWDIGSTSAALCFTNVHSMLMCTLIFFEIYIYNNNYKYCMDLYGLIDLDTFFFPSRVRRALAMFLAATVHELEATSKHKADGWRASVSMASVHHSCERPRRMNTHVKMWWYVVMCWFCCIGTNTREVLPTCEYHGASALQSVGVLAQKVNYPESADPVVQLTGLTWAKDQWMTSQMGKIYSLADTGELDRN